MTPRQMERFDLVKTSVEAAAADTARDPVDRRVAYAIASALVFIAKGGSFMEPDDVVRINAYTIRRDATEDLRELLKSVACYCPVDVQDKIAKVTS